MKGISLLQWAILLCAISIFTYFPSLFGSFVWDDEDFVYQNQYVLQANIGHLFTRQALEGRGKTSSYYRPIQFTSYAIMNRGFGLNPFIFHLFNIVVHTAAACGIMVLFFLLTRNLPLSFLLATVFTVHPIQTEAVSYVSGLSDPLFVMFGVFSLIFYLLRRKKAFYIYLSWLFFFCSLLSKESGVVFLGIVVLLCIYKEKIKGLLHALPYLGITLFYGFLHLALIDNSNLKSAWGNNPYSNSVLVRLLTFVQDLYTYVSLLVFPGNLYMERDFSIKAQTSLLNPYLFGFIVFNILLGIYLYHFRRQDKDFKLFLFLYGCLWVSLLPATGILLINGIFYEHYMYFPLVFFFGFIMFLFKDKIGQKTMSVIVIVLILFIVRSWVRQWDWIDNVRFYTQTLQHAPKSIRIRNNLAMTYADKGDIDQAILEYQNAVKIDPTVPNLYHNLGNAYGSKGDPGTAEKYYLKAIQVDPNFWFSYVSLLKLYQATGQKDKFDKLLSVTKQRFPNLGK